MEIDVVGIKIGVAILIDCKHWKRTSTSAIHTAIKKQIERTKRYVSQTQGAMAIPAIVTLYEEKMAFINKIPIVPIQKFSSFVDEFYGNLDKVEIIKSN
jgi:endo-1,4-beta-D-glucanase Y